MSRKYFGTDGIRDVAGEGLLAPGLVAVYGRSLGAMIARTRPGGRVLIGRDTRASGPWMVGSIVDGLCAAGLHAVDGGVLTTPAVQTLCREEGFASAIVVSASHNPAHDNGIKVFGGDGRKLADAGEALVEELIDGPSPPPAAVRGTFTTDADAARRYVHFMRTVCLPTLDLRGRTVVLDCAHGAASEIGPRVLEAFNARALVVNAAPDGNNINDGAGVFHVKDLAGLVKNNGPAIGVALDGDADRAQLLDENGELRDGDDILAVLGADLLARGELPGDAVVTTVMANFGLSVLLRNLKLRQETVPVGDRHVAERMATTGLILGGEQSGHVIFRDGDRWFGDGLFTALRVLDVMVRSRKTLAQLCAAHEKFPQVLINVKVRERAPIETIPGLAPAAAAAEATLAGAGRVLLRYSGTEKILRVMVEGRDHALVTRLADELALVVRGAIGVAPAPGTAGTR